MAGVNAAAVPAAAALALSDDSMLLHLEEKLRRLGAANAYNDEIERLDKIWHAMPSGFLMKK
ncbi:hypothetical protein [Bradyrhizobium sp. USDA 4473]